MDPLAPVGMIEPAAIRNSSAAAPSAEQAAQDFEAFFLMQAFETMFAGVSMNGPFGGGQTEKTYRSFLLDAYARQLAESGGVGIAPAVQADIEAAYGALKEVP